MTIKTQNKWGAILALTIGIYSANTTEAQAQARTNPMIGGMNLSEQGSFIYDAAPAGGAKTQAQIAVDQIKALGARHVILNPRATMTDPKGNDLFPMVPITERGKERARYQRLIQYIHSIGLTVGIRPIFFVVRPNGTFPYREVQPDGKEKIWWHGNIQPNDPNRWFESFKSYLDIYVLIAQINHVEEFTLGAELYSMTVGIEDQWKAYPYGFPGRWLDLLHYCRGKLGAKVRIMYDINFTDDITQVGSVSASGGEFERWRYRLVDLANPTDPAQLIIWKDLVAFWNELDAVGIDMYRSLAGKQDTLPMNQADLVKHLRIRSDEYASQMDTSMVSIEAATGRHQFAIFKEAGFRSVDKGFIDPFNYENGVGTYNVDHQAAAFEALYESFWMPKFDWFGGGSFWDVGVDPSRNIGVGDTGFSPINKTETDLVLRKIYQVLP